MNDIMQLLNALGLRRDTLGGQIGDRLANNTGDYDMRRMRQMRPNDQSFQNYVAPLEHQQFMREMAQNSPAAGMGAAMMASPYSAGKAMAPGLTQALAGGAEAGGPIQSQPSLEELIRALQGYGQGMMR